MNITWRNEANASPELASRTRGNGEEEIGELYCLERTVRRGAIRATYEYNIYHWLESDEWEADVVSPHGWHDVPDDELKYILRELKLADV